MAFLYHGTIVKTPARKLTTAEEINIAKGYRPTNAILIWNDDLKVQLLQVKSDNVKRIKWAKEEEMKCHAQ